MIDFLNETDDTAAEAVVGDLFTIFREFCAGKEIELIFVDDAQIREINHANRGIDKATDVLSFPLDFPGSEMIGTIVISLDTAKSAALELGHGYEDEVKLLFIHGLLHLMGYDHEVDNGQMRQKEEELISRYALPSSLIVRNEA
jgi:probable rRNA maturation factor